LAKTTLKTIGERGSRGVFSVNSELITDN